MYKKVPSFLLMVVVVVVQDGRIDYNEFAAMMQDPGFGKSI